MVKRHDLSEEEMESFMVLLEQIQRDIKSLMYDIESQTTDKVTDKPPKEFIFDVVPILNKLREALKYTTESCYIYESKLKKLTKQKST